jgi:Trypsin-co-occurring domain 2
MGAEKKSAAVHPSLRPGGDGIGLGETLQLLRDELISSMAVSAAAPVRFRIDSIDVELRFTVTKTAGLNGGVQFWVVTAGGKTSTESSAEHSVTLHLSALTASGGEVLTNDVPASMPR